MAEYTTEYKFPSILDRANATDDRQFDGSLLRHVQNIRDWGKSFVESQPPYKEIDRALDILRRDTEPSLASGLSRISVNRIKRENRDLVAAVSNLRPMENARSHNTEMADGIYQLNKLCKYWWVNTFADRKYRSVCQYASGLGTGYAEPWWDNNYYGHGRGEINIKSHGPSSVLPVMITKDFDLQKAYSTTIVEETPLHILLASFPTKAHLIQPSRNMPGWMDKAVEKAKSAVNGVLGVLQTPMNSNQGQMPTTDVFYTYTMDPSVNNTGRRMSMGKPGTSWHYEVPYIGEQIPAGVKDRNGNALFREATADDCRIYPLRRLTIWTDTCILQDDTSPYLHGRVPLVQLRFDDYPWDFLGYGICHDTWKIQRARNKLLRAMCDSADVRLQPPLSYDENMISDAFMAKLNTRRPGQSVKMNTSMGEPIKALLPVQHWDVPAWIVQLYTQLGEEQDNLAIVKDLTAIAKAKQVPSGDAIEKILEMAGPVVQDIARGGEKFICEFAMLWYPMALQFYPSRRKIKVLGPEAFTEEDGDFTPGSMIPSHLPGEDKALPSSFQLWQRTQWTIEQMSYEIEPYSQAQVSRVGRVLLLLQMMKAGMPIDPWTIMKAANIDIGEEPDGTTNAMMRYVAFQRMKAELAQEMQQMQQQGQQGPGRPQSNKSPAVIKSKDGGTRSTVSTSR